VCRLMSKLYGPLHEKKPFETGRANKFIRMQENNCIYCSYDNYSG
jgi:hypothetical protein